MADLPAPDMPPADSRPVRPPLSAGVIAAMAFAGAAALALLTGWGLATMVQSRTAEVIHTRMLTAGYDWARVETDGLIVALSGTAPTEAQRFAAMNLAGSVVESGRLRDDFKVQPGKVIAPPRFSVEMLRNDDGVQLIGLVPDGKDRGALTEAALALKSTLPATGPAIGHATGPVTDMLETASYPAPDGWGDALTFGVAALELLPRAKISVAAEGVTIVAIASSDAEKRQFEAALLRATPKGLIVSTTITAPRPVLTPFTLRFVMDSRGARFDACSADTEAAQRAILAAATAAGAKGNLTCTIGMGVPSPHWAEATAAAINELATLGAGTVTFSDADITFLAGDSVTQVVFDRSVGELRAALPDVFSLDAKMPEKAVAVKGPVEFTASLDPKTHRAELRGRLNDDRMQAVVASFAKARFGVGKVYVATLLDPTLPDGWTERVLAGVQALAALDNGHVVVRTDTVEVTGISGSKTASDTISQLLSDRLGQGKTFTVNVGYDKALDPMAGLPTPAECLERVQAVQAKQKITFDPGSSEIAATASGVMDGLTLALKNCGALRLEIGGHTDAQGSTNGNQALSQARAEAVLIALQGRQVDVSLMQAKGYGKSTPVADNTSDAGREANRRIEFTLMDTLASPAQPRANTASTAAVADPATQVLGTTPPSLPPVSETGTNGASLAPDQQTVRPKTRPTP